MAGGRLTELERPAGQAGPDRSFEYELAPAGRVEGAPRRADRRQSVTVSRHRRYAARPAPDPTSPQLTGRYEDVAGGFTLMLNQAGKHLELWLAEVLMGDAARRAELQGSGGADLGADGVFTVFHPEHPDRAVGTLRPITVDDRPGVQLELRSDSGAVQLRFRRLNTVPVVSDQALEGIPRDQIEIVATERAPLLSSFVRWLRNRLSPDRINPFLRRFFDIDAASRMAFDVYRYNALIELDRYVGEVFSTEGAEGWHPSDLPLARFYARNLLGQQRFTHNETERIVLEWMQIMLARMADNIQGRDHDFANLRIHLGLTKPTRAAGQGLRAHRYDIQFYVGGLGGDVGLVGLGGFIGALTVKQTTAPRWQRDYLLWFGQLGAGVGASITMGQENDGSANSAFEWTPDDFPGWVSLMGSGAHAGLGIGGGPGAQVMIVYGRGNLPPLAVDLSSWWSFSSEIGGGVDILTLGWGRLYQQDQVNRRILPPREVTVQRDQVVEGRAAGAVHFRLGDALLTEDARQVLRVVLAKELRGFMDTGSVLAITGHTDRVDRPDRNVELSQLRAFNVYQAIRDILGDRLLIPEGQTYVYWFGEQEAAEAGDPDELANQRFRRVNVVLNHRLILSLRGE